MLECIIPILRVENLAASIDHYVKVLGFRKDWDWGDPPDFGSVSRDNFSIMLCEGGQGEFGTWLWIGVEDVGKVYEEYKGSGASILMEPTNFPWAREMKVEDLDGHVLRIGSEPEDETHSGSGS